MHVKVILTIALIGFATALDLSQKQLDRLTNVFFKSLDWNKDGSVSPTEWDSGLSSIVKAGIATEKASVPFADVDTDANGAISKEELAAFLKKKTEAVDGDAVVDGRYNLKKITEAQQKALDEAVEKKCGEKKTVSLSAYSECTKKQSSDECLQAVCNNTALTKRQYSNSQAQIKENVKYYAMVTFILAMVSLAIPLLWIVVFIFIIITYVETTKLK
jgi:Ca2+-binding EF-hand superfamily protein